MQANEKATFWRRAIEANIEVCLRADPPAYLVRQLDDLAEDARFENDLEMLRALMIKSRELRDRASGV